MIQSLIRGWLRRPVNGTPVVANGSVPAPFLEFGRYPPDPDGYPVVTTDHMISNQQDLIALIRRSVRFTDRDRWQLLFEDAIRRYASFVHLLPASERDHHHGVGGLFRHGLEVAHKTILLGYAHAQDMTNYPSQNRLLEQRWSYACFIAGLCHDLGKAVSDMTVTDKSGSHQWSPYSETLLEWATRLKIDRYYIHYRPNRHKRHSAFSVKVFSHIARTDGEVFLSDVSDQLMHDVIDAVMGSSSSLANLVAYVSKADALSCEEDRKRNPVADTGTGHTAAAPAHKFIFDSIRRCIEEKVWVPNDKNSPLFIINRGLYLIWPRAAADIVSRLSSPSGIPTNPATMAEMLEERGLIVSYAPQPDIKNTYWSILPEPLEADNRNQPLKAICFDRATRFYDMEPDSVAAKIYDPVELARYLKAGSKSSVMPEPKAQFTAITINNQSPPPEPLESTLAEDAQHSEVANLTEAEGLPPPPPPQTSSRAPGAAPTPSRLTAPILQEPAIPKGARSAEGISIDPPKQPSRKRPPAENASSSEAHSTQTSLEDAISAIEYQARGHLSDIPEAHTHLEEFDFDKLSSSPPPSNVPTERSAPKNRGLHPGASAPTKLTTTPNDAMTNRMFFQRSGHLIGSTLLALAERINERQDAPERHLIATHKGLVVLQYPDCISDLGIPPKSLVSSLKEADWLTHHLNLGSIKDDVVFPKSVVLNDEISRRFLAVLGPGLISSSPDKSATAAAIQRIRATIKSDAQEPAAQPPRPPPPKPVILDVDLDPAPLGPWEGSAQLETEQAIKSMERASNAAPGRPEKTKAKVAKPKSTQVPAQGNQARSSQGLNAAQGDAIAGVKSRRKAMLGALRQIHANKPHLFVQDGAKSTYVLRRDQIEAAVGDLGGDAQDSAAFAMALDEMPVFKPIVGADGFNSLTVPMDLFPSGAQDQ